MAILGSKSNLLPTQNVGDNLEIVYNNQEHMLLSYTILVIYNQAKMIQCICFFYIKNINIHDNVICETIEQ